MNWIRAIFCLLGGCLRCKTVDDDTGIWGECIDCGRRHGFVKRSVIADYADRCAAMDDVLAGPHRGAIMLRMRRLGWEPGSSPPIWAWETVANEVLAEAMEDGR